VIPCFYHPDRDAVNTCSRCGQPVCSECNYVTGTQPICRNCWDKRLFTHKEDLSSRAAGTGKPEGEARAKKSEKSASRGKLKGCLISLVIVVLLIAAIVLICTPSTPSTVTPVTPPPALDTVPYSPPPPVTTPSVTSCPGATAICNDGTCSNSQHRSGTCSHHGGVRQWINRPPD
jgi:hypothetical protein